MKRSICTTATTIALFGALLSPIGGLAPAMAAPVPPAVSDIGTRLLGKTVFLDPGHQGGGTAAQMDQLVDNGRGGRKPCQTSGMTALGGLPEHTITWRVAQLVKSSLQNLGARVVLSRPDDVGWGGCVTDRARAAGASGASVAISIHADGAPAGDHGFHFIVPQLPIPNPLVNAVQSTQGRAATLAVRDAYLHYGFQPANYAGTVDGLQTRSDIAGPALTAVPDVFVEMGNGANPGDATSLTTPQGQLRHALAITTGLVGYLLGTHTGGPVSQPLPAPVLDDQPNAGAPPSGGGTQSPAAGVSTSGGGVSGVQAQPSAGGVQLPTNAQTSGGGALGAQAQAGGMPPSAGGAQLSGGGAQSLTGGAQVPGAGVQSQAGAGPAAGASAQGGVSPSAPAVGVPGSDGQQPSRSGMQFAPGAVYPTVSGPTTGGGYPATLPATTAPSASQATSLTALLMPLLSALGVRLPAGGLANVLVAGLLSTLIGR